MANTEELYQALRNADSAGDTEAASRLAAYVQSLSASPVSPESPPKTPMEALERIQPSAPKTPNPLPEGNPLTGAIGTAGGMIQNLGAGLAGNIGAIPTALVHIGGKGHEAEEKASEIASKFAHVPLSQTEKDYTEKLGNVIGSLPPVLGEGFGSAGASAQIMKGRAGASIAKALSPSPEALALALKAKDFGIEVRPDMLYNNKLLKMIGEALEHVPLSGAGKEARQEAFNNSLVKQIGGDEKATKLTPDVFEKAITQSGETRGRIAKEGSVSIDRDFHDKLQGLSQSLNKATPDNQRIVIQYAKDFMSKVDPLTGKIPGDSWREINTDLGSRVRGAGGEPDLQRHLKNLQKVFSDKLQGSLPRDKAELFRDAGIEYANALSIEPLVAKATGTEGNIPPAQLMGAVANNKSSKKWVARGKGGDMADLAAIGQRFLKEPPSSGTAERSMVYGGLSALGGAAGATAPAIALPAIAGLYVLANLYNRLGPKVTSALEGRSPSRISPPTNLGALSQSISRLEKPTPGLLGRTYPNLYAPPLPENVIQAKEED